MWLRQDVRYCVHNKKLAVGTPLCMRADTALMNRFWVTAGSFDWFPVNCLPLLIVYLCSGTSARPLGELGQEENIH